MGGVRGRTLTVVIRRSLAPLVLALLLVAGANAATRTYSSGPLALPIPDGGTASHSIAVRDAGPLSHVAVAVRIDHPRDRDLTLTLTSPSGRTVTLVSGSGDGANFGRGRGCRGPLTEFDDAYGEPIADSAPPFADAPLRPEQPLKTFRRDQARGRWTLRLHDAGDGLGGTLRCWQLVLGRDVVTVERGRSGSVVAELSYRESNDVYREPRLRIVRDGRVALDRPLPRVGCGGGACPGWRPAGPPVVRDLDADGEPEVIVDEYSGGAHCCTYSVLFRRAGGGYSTLVHRWGNVGYRLLDLDRDGRPELRSADDRFAYAFTAYATSLDPVQVWRYEHGRLVDVTRSFPGAVAADARAAWRLYLRERRARPREVRGVLAAWLADQLLLGRSAAGWRALDAAYRRGDLGRGPRLYGYPAGTRYLAALRAFLRRTGYL
jgi:subtilisin-like proprotein convertase family protein